MQTSLLARLLLVVGAPAVWAAGCGGQTTDDTGQTSPSAAQGGAAGGGAGGEAGGEAGQTQAGSGGAAAGAGGATAGAGGAKAGAGGESAGAGGACAMQAICAEGSIALVCVSEAEPIPFTDCGGGVCVLQGQMCPGGGVGGAGGASGGAGGASGGAGGSIQGGTGGATGVVTCLVGSPCVEDSWCQRPSASSTPFHCVKGAYSSMDPPPFEAKVCLDKQGECDAVNSPDLSQKIYEEYSWSCTAVTGEATPLVQVASNGAERCCYQVMSICVGRPLWVQEGARLASLVAGGGWG